jgi:hypothetical protein
MINNKEGLKWFDYRGIYKNGEGYYWWRSSDNSERPSIIYVFKESVDYIWIAQNGKGVVSNRKYRFAGPLCPPRIPAYISPILPAPLAEQSLPEDRYVSPTVAELREHPSLWNQMKSTLIATACASLMNLGSRMNSRML